MPGQRDIEQGIDAGERVPVRSGAGHLMGVVSDYHLAGVDWGYYSKMTHILEYTYNHPEGFVGHFAWQGEGEWRVRNLWRDEQTRERFFAEYAAERLSRGIQLLGAVSTISGVTDVEPIQFRAVGFLLGPRARAFAGIGEDLDGSAIDALGTEPIALELDVGGMRAGDYELMVAGLGYAESVPAELISHHAVETSDGVQIFETWSGRDAALGALAAWLEPAIEHAGDLAKRGFDCIRREFPVARISLHPDAVDAFGF